MRVQLNEEGVMGIPDSLRVTTFNRQRKIGVDRVALQQVVHCAVSALEGEAHAKGVVSLVLVSDRRIQQLNRDFAGINEPTDVLSFSAREGGAVLPGDEEDLGDIFVSVETASRQVGRKDRRGHPRTESLMEEVALLFVHGVLHLLGYDHAEAVQAREMLACEQVIMVQVRAETEALPGSTRPTKV